MGLKIKYNDTGMGRVNGKWKKSDDGTAVR